MLEQLWSELCTVYLDPPTEVLALDDTGTGVEIATPRVLIQCVNDRERQGIIDACHDFGLTDAPGAYINGKYCGAEPLGVLGGLELILTQTDAGSSRPTASQGVVTDAIDEFDPVVVIAVGVAFGLKIGLPGKGESPCVAIAKETRDYEEAKLGAGSDGRLLIHERGYTGNPNPTLITKVAAVGRNIGMTIKSGQMLSGDKLVNHEGFRAVLKERFPDAIAGEMEGTGVAAACARREKPWLLVKGVSDLGYGKHGVVDGEDDAGDQDDQRQLLAARTAMTLVLTAIDRNCLNLWTNS
jgi:nucleoside phosphorylase